ncbi:MAG TPA: NADH-ubiquinone oxidoreductase-F iron-sulfur binding region domain-containing protein [Dehalococcoidia bacterium]|nr:NADH-ubiquinone oxidoreductase-F iron-sulfur binding region domain-containing protein [Dehalococcoidia bacterium]
MPAGGGSIDSLDSYRESGGLRGYERARKLGPAGVIDELRDSGLRGRGGAGFPTATKWGGIFNAEAERKFVCCNAAEGEPGTFKDRYLLRTNPYPTLEGLAIEIAVFEPEAAYICLKESFKPEIARVQKALDELRPVLPELQRLEIVLGPDEYLYGEEKAMLEVIEGGLPLPRVFPPYIHGLFAGAYGGPGDKMNNPTVVNNVETLAHVPGIIANGASWFRELGSDESPGTMIFTVSGDIKVPVVAELPLGLTLRELIHDHAGGPVSGDVRAVFPGVANAVATPALLDTPLGFDSMKQAGSALGSAGFIVYDETACLARVAYLFSRFLFVESCNQCPPCKIGSRRITELLEKLLQDEADEADLEEIHATTTWVENGQRCYLASSEALVIASTLAFYPDDFRAHLTGDCKRRHDMPLPKMVDYIAGQGFKFDERYLRKLPDWSYLRRAQGKLFDVI